MRAATMAIALLWTAVPGAAQTPPPPPPPPENLQVLPATMTLSEVRARMSDVAGGLGVQCLYCHDGTSMSDVDYASDAKQTKRTAREMMRMMNRINEELSNLMPDRDDVRVDCVTCHRGATRPLLLEDSLETVLRGAGLDMALATYDSLRARYYGRMVFDFGQRSLNVLAARLVRDERYAEAIRVLELNGTHFPGSWDVPYELGRIYERMGDTANAIAQYRRTLELRPTHTAARARLTVLAPGG